MLASSSRVTLSAVTRSLRAPRSGFSTASVAYAKREVRIELLQDVEGLGLAYEKVSVPPGRARNTLVASRQARYIPWKRPSDKERSSSSRHTPQPITDALASPGIAAEVFANLPPRLVFPLRTTSPSASTVHGSVTLADVAHRLETEYGLASGDVTMSWLDRDESERIKELGVWDVLIKSKHGEEGMEAELEVEVARLQE